jgi:hypothetical protein
MSKQHRLKVAIEAIDQVSRPMMAINQKMRAWTGSISKAQSRHFLPKAHHSLTLFSHHLTKLSRVSGLPRISEQFVKIGQSAVNAQSSVKRLLLTLTAPGLVISGVGFGFKALLSHASSEASRLQNLSQSLGLGIDQIQAFQFAASKAGVSNEDLASSLTNLSRASVQASMGVGDSSNIFQALRMNPMDGKQVKSTDQLFLELSSKLSAMKNAPLKTEFANQLLGGSAVLPLLNQGRKGIQANLIQAQSMPFAIGPKEIALSAKYQASLGTFLNLLERLRNALGSVVLPLITEVFSKLNTYVIGNKEELKQFFVNFSQGLPEALQQGRIALTCLSDTFSSLASVLQWINQKVGISNILIGFIGLKALATAISVIQLVGSFGKFIGLLASYGIPTLILLASVLSRCFMTLATNPVILICLALYRLVRVTQFVCEKFESFRQLFENTFSSPLEFLGRILTLIKTIGKAFIHTDWAALGLDEYLSEKRKLQISPLDSASLALPRVPSIALQRGPMDLAKLSSAAQSNRPNVSKNEGTDTDAKVTVRFENAPAGMRVREQKGRVQTEVNRGLSFLGATL